MEDNAELEAQRGMTQETTSPFDPRSIFNPAKWLFGIIAVLTGLSALYLRWKTNP
jgi:hypothetical protein